MSTHETRDGVAHPTAVERALEAQDAEVDRLIEDAMATDNEMAARDLIATRAPPQAEEDEGAYEAAQYAIGGDVSEWSARHRQAADEAEDLGPEVGNWHPGLPIESEADLGRAIAFLRNRRHEVNEAKRRAAQTIRDAEAWLSKRLHGVKGVETQAAALEVRILAYAREHPEVFGGKKTAKFPGGSIKQRERKEGYYRKVDGAENERALLKWALAEEAAERPDPAADPLVHPSQEMVVDLDRVKEYLETISTSEPGNGGVGQRVTAPGLEWVPPGVDYSVKTGES